MTRRASHGRDEPACHSSEIPPPTISADLALAFELAELAARISLPRFAERSFETRDKRDGSPVTDVDLAVEAALRAELARRRPDDMVVGEEHERTGRARRRWYLDPTDGTSRFVAGDPGWMTLIALADGDRIRVGVVDLPARRERWWASDGGGAFHDGRPIAVSARSSLADAIVCDSWRGDLARDHRDHPLSRVAEHAAAVRPHRGHGMLAVACGEADVAIQVGSFPWDHAPLKVIVEEAGGTFTDLDGGERIDTGGVVATNGRVHAEVLGHVGSRRDVEIVVAHDERATLRVGDLFLKVDPDPARQLTELRAMALAPIPTPEVVSHHPPVLTLARLTGTPLGRLGEPTTAPAAAWRTVGAAIRTLHDAPLPPWSERDRGALAARLDDECGWLVATGVLDADVVAVNRRLADAALRRPPIAFTHGDLQIGHVFVDGDALSGVIDWSEAGPGDPLADLAALTLGHEECLTELLAGYGAEVDLDVVAGWWSLRSLTAAAGSSSTDSTQRHRAASSPSCARRRPVAAPPDPRRARRDPRTGRADLFVCA